MTANDTISVLNDVASVKNGGRILFSTDDFFAVAENLIKHEAPQWYEDKYTEFGKEMDGWETRRRRTAGHDFCILQLAALTQIVGVEIDTAFFTGNHAPLVSIQASDKIGYKLGELDRIPELGTDATADEIAVASEDSKEWETILGPVTLKPGYPETRHNTFTIDSNKVWRYLRLNLFPDGGVARLHVFGHVRPLINASSKQIIDLVAFENGGECVEYSNAHFGHPRNLVAPFRGVGMFDGWETARQLNRTGVLKESDDGNLDYIGIEWCILKFGVAGTIVRIVVDTNHFKGNFPDRVQIEASNDKEVGNKTVWETVLPYQKVGPHKEHEFLVQNEKVYQYIKLSIVPDGGISRLRVYGRPLRQ